MADKDLFLGIDIGGTKVHGLLADRAGTIVAQARIATDTRGSSHLIDQLLAMQSQLCDEAAIAAPKAVGIGVPAAVDPQTRTLSAIPNIDNMEGDGFYPALCAAFGTNVALENDVNCAALAEARTVDGSKARSIAFIAIGTGIGMGIVSEGYLLRGLGGAAGEIAFLPIGDNLAHDELRYNGTLESHLGGAGWRARYLELTGRHDCDLAAQFANPDAAFNELLGEQADLLAKAVLTVNSIIAPEEIVLGGSIGAQPLLLEKLNMRLPHYSRQGFSLRTSQISDVAGALGAADAARLALG